jgi:hypothetical protein
VHPDERWIQPDRHLVSLVGQGYLVLPAANLVGQAHLVLPAGHLAFAEAEERSVFLEVVSPEVVVSPDEEPVLQELAFRDVFPLRPRKAMKRRQTAIPLKSRSMLSLSYPCPLIFFTWCLPMSVPRTLSTFTASYAAASPTTGVPASLYRISIIRRRQWACKRYKATQADASIEDYQENSRMEPGAEKNSVKEGCDGAASNGPDLAAQVIHNFLELLEDTIYH